METAGYTTELLKRQWFSEKTFEAVFSRPTGFQFTPGQRIRLLHQSIERDYSLVNGTTDVNLAICIRHVAGGLFSSLLAQTVIGTRFKMTGPHGYFVFRASNRPAIFVATGTGIAPFAALARSGVRGHLVLHGVRQKKDLYYASLIRSTSHRYVACLTEDPRSVDGVFNGRVTDYLATQMEGGLYDFYVCGREDMIRDVIWLVDDHFPGSRVYNEIFY